MIKYKIEIASVPDKENLVAEIWCDELLIAEINQENEELEIELFIDEKKSFELNEFLELIQMAKRKLLQEDSQKK